MRLVSVVGTLCCAITLTAARPQPAPAHFRMTLERIGQTWRAQCDSGCHWTSLSYECSNNCRVQIDANGVSQPGAEPATTSPFAFVLTRTGNEFTVKSVAGTAWTTASWGCGALTGLGSCRAELTESGVRPLLLH